MFIPDPIFFHPGSRIRLKECKYFNPGKISILTQEKWFLSSRKYNLGCSSSIRILTFYTSRIPDPGVKQAPDPGSATLQKLQNYTPVFRELTGVPLFSGGPCRLSAGPSRLTGPPPPPRPPQWSAGRTLAHGWHPPEHRDNVTAGVVWSQMGGGGGGGGRSTTYI
jgi:hypothetical protein